MSRNDRPGRSDFASEALLAHVGSGFGSAPEAETVCFGCSMLSRIRLRPRKPEALCTMRCSLGYALRSAEEIARCLAVEGPGDCWKTSPTWRVVPGEGKTRERGEAQAETHVTTLGHGDKVRVTSQVVATDVSVERPGVVELVQVQVKARTDAEVDD